MPQRAEVDSVYDFYVVQRIVYYALLCVMFPIYVLQIWAEYHDYSVCARAHHTDVPPVLQSAQSSSGHSATETSRSGSGTPHSPLHSPHGNAQPATLRPVPAEARGAAVAWVVYWLRRCGLLQCTLLLVWNVDLSGALGVYSRGVTHLQGNWAITMVFVMLSLWTIANVSAQYQQTRQRKPKLLIAFLVALPVVFAAVATVSAAGLIATDVRQWQAVENFALGVCCVTYAVVGAAGYLPLRRSLVAHLDKHSAIPTEHVRAALTKLTVVFAVVFVALVAVAVNAPFDFVRNITYDEPLRPPSTEVDRAVAAFNCIYLLTVLVPLMYTYHPVRCCPPPPAPRQPDLISTPRFKPSANARTNASSAARSGVQSPRTDDGAAFGFGSGGGAVPDLALGAAAADGSGDDTRTAAVGRSESIAPPPPPRTDSMAPQPQPRSDSTPAPPPGSLTPAPMLAVVDERMAARNASSVRRTGTGTGTGTDTGVGIHSGSAAAAAGASAGARNDRSSTGRGDGGKRSRHSRQMPLLPEVLRLYASRQVLQEEDDAVAARAARYAADTDTDADTEAGSLPPDASAIQLNRI